MINDLICSTRSFRRFDQNVTITRQILVELVDLARHSASAKNLQPLKYFLSWESESNASIFATLTWAAALKDWGGPAKGERPSAYIIVLGDTELSTHFGYDPGIASQSIMLGARERGLGGCMLASIDRLKLHAALNISDRYEILLVLAIGKPAETVIIEPIGPDDNTGYWRDSQGVHHVPKRSLDEIILTN